ncbi:hypothetical protein PsYK624_092660 [Phanerochaete sordida]|uniref:Uncharacterized protein n=1 Tax=Phanerochaete sordida TaxID=48140 RepID=A0A9P3GE57_9APHY|nr:hypothetical protein PsYK624_092660 [Phanerochaete sordida]
MKMRSTSTTRGDRAQTCANGVRTSTNYSRLLSFMSALIVLEREQGPSKPRIVFRATPDPPLRHYFDS